MKQDDLVEETQDVVETSRHARTAGAASSAVAAAATVGAVALFASQVAPVAAATVMLVSALGGLLSTRYFNHRVTKKGRHLAINLARSRQDHEIDQATMRSLVAALQKSQVQLPEPLQEEVTRLEAELKTPGENAEAGPLGHSST